MELFEKRILTEAEAIDQKRKNRAYVGVFYSTDPDRDAVCARRAQDVINNYDPDPNRVESKAGKYTPYIFSGIVALIDEYAENNNYYSKDQKPSNDEYEQIRDRVFRRLSNEGTIQNLCNYVRRFHEVVNGKYTRYIYKGKTLNNIETLGKSLRNLKSFIDNNEPQLKDNLKVDDPTAPSFGPGVPKIGEAGGWGIYMPKSYKAGMAAFGQPAVELVKNPNDRRKETNTSRTYVNSKGETMPCTWGTGWCTYWKNGNYWDTYHREGNLLLVLVRLGEERNFNPTNKATCKNACQLTLKKDGGSGILYYADDLDSVNVQNFFSENPEVFKFLEEDPEYSQYLTAYLDSADMIKSGLSISGTVLNGYTGTSPSPIIPNRVTEVAKMCFAGNDVIERFEAPINLTKIGYKAFYGCTSLETAIIGASEVEMSAFEGCTSLNEVRNISKLTTIPNNMFKGCSSLYRMFPIPGTVRSIQSGAFEGTALETIAMDDGVEEILRGAFKDCTSLRKVGFPNTLKRITSGAFDGCSALEEVVLPSGVTQVSSYAFGKEGSCPSVEVVSLPGTLKRFDKSSFEGCSNAIFKTSSPELYVRLKDECEYNVEFTGKRSDLEDYMRNMQEQKNESLIIEENKKEPEFDRRILKKDGEELQDYLNFRRRGSKVEPKKGKGSYNRNEKHKGSSYVYDSYNTNNASNGFYRLNEDVSDDQFDAAYATSKGNSEKIRDFSDRLKKVDAETKDFEDASKGVLDAVKNAVLSYAAARREMFDVSVRWSDSTRSTVDVTIEYRYRYGRIHWSVSYRVDPLSGEVVSSSGVDNNIQELVDSGEDLGSYADDLEIILATAMNLEDFDWETNLRNTIDRGAYFHTELGSVGVPASSKVSEMLLTTLDSDSIVWNRQQGYCYKMVYGSPEGKGTGLCKFIMFRHKVLSCPYLKNDKRKQKEAIDSSIRRVISTMTTRGLSQWISFNDLVSEVSYLDNPGSTEPSTIDIDNNGRENVADKRYAQIRTVIYK